MNRKGTRNPGNYFGPLSLIFNLVTLTLLSFPFASSSLETISFKVMGKLHYLKPGDSRNTWGFEYYLKTEKDGKAYVIPVIIPKEKMAKAKGAYLNESVFIAGTLKQKTVTVGETLHKVSFLLVDEIQALKLSSLGVDPKDTSKMVQTAAAVGTVFAMTGTTPMVGVQTTVPDHVANAMIFTAGAALIGSILLK